MIETYLQIPGRQPWEKLTSLNEMLPIHFSGRCPLYHVTICAPLAAHTP